MKVVTLGRCACGAALKRRQENENVVYQTWWEAGAGRIGHAHEVKA